MKKRWNGIQIISFAIMLIAASGSLAEKMDESTDSLVIDKLERALDLMENDAPERKNVELRLADLYAERARLKLIEEGKKSCENCTGAKEDRTKALSYYKDALPQTKGDDQGKILVQMAHLNNLNGDNGKAQNIYGDVIKKGRKKYASGVVGSAFINTAEIQFREGKFKQAKANYEKAAKEEIPNRGFVEYRLAWCELNLGHPEVASQKLISVLSTPEYSSDATFKEDVSRDLPVFIAHTNVGPKEIDLVRSLSPEKTRKANLFALGTETDRLGKKQAAMLVWAAYAKESDVKDGERLEIQIRLAQEQYDIGHQKESLVDYEKAIAMWKAQPCSGDKEKCDELKSRLRKFVLAWNKAQKVKPTPQLLQVYTSYLIAFPDDAEMTQWAALVARDVKQYRGAVALFRRSALLAKSDKTPAGAKVLEGSLLGEIEMAEASKDLKLREDAYSFYLSNNPQGTKAFDARFQRANVWYQQSKHQEAYSEFHYLATTGGPEHHAIKLKAADLALDCLVLLKDDKSLEIRAKEYARIFPERQKEYAVIARKAALNQVAQSLNNKNVDRSVYAANLEKLKTVNLDGAKNEDKVKYWKNRLQVALHAKELKEVDVAADGLLSVSRISAADRDYAYTQKEWVAELTLNFGAAYHYAQLAEKSTLSRGDRDLRLALLAELSGADSGKHYEDYLRHEPNAHSRNLTRITLVQRSSHPWRELNRHLPELRRSMDLLAPLAMETYGRSPNNNELRRLFGKTSLRSTAQGRVLVHQLEYGSFERFRSATASMRLNNSNDFKLQQSLKGRLGALAMASQKLNKFSREHDGTMETAALRLLGKENRRLADDLLRLPAPRRLNAVQKQQYHAILQQKANGFMMTAARFEQQWQSKWTEGTLKEMERNIQAASPEVATVLKGEIQILAANAPESARGRLQGMLKEGHTRPSQREIMVARLDLQKDPFDRSKVENLRELEKQAGQTTMVSYLDARLNQMKRGGTL